MSEPQNSSSAGRRCPQCGAELPGDLPPELCPKCLLKTGLATQPENGPRGTIIVSAEAVAPGLPQPGEELGHYRIVRSLGGGGMGTVFEAEDLENGRRVALKVLSQALDSPEARHRFFREGRLAASINHPNSVYVFGTEELGGIPIITMELVAGGTLEECVRSRGPMPTTEAVDAVLQIIAGLEVAQRIGILHRDVKPSNCFVDADGTVKIGDFGLSISTAVRTETALTAAGSFLGTPAFCSPEQLRCEELNAKSDMYSVGATLFYLLTGRTAYQAKNVVALIATVLEQPAPSPRQFQPKLSRGLSKVVRRCLEKQPGERFKNYEELRKALAPYSSTAPAPATLGLRFVAGILDMLFLVPLGMLIPMAAASLETQTRFSLLNFADLLSDTSRQAQAIAFIVPLGWVLYYALLEGIWGVTLGKLACGLRVVGQDNNPPGFFRALPRPVLCVLVPNLPAFLILGINPTINTLSTARSFALQMLVSVAFFLLLGLLFSTARRRNGFAAIHDLVTKTRVVSRTSLAARSAPAVGEASPPDIEAKPLIGPFHVLDTIEESDGTAWLLGYDLRLLRKVWIRTVPASAPQVAAPLRNLGRSGHLRWLAGRRSTQENWDAFEAVSGQALLQLLQEKKRRTTGKDDGPASNPQPWAQVRFWLCDLATELSAAQKDSTLPSLLALDRVWITADGGAKLLDFPAPGLLSAPVDVHSPPIANNTDIPRFLSQIAAAALKGQADAAAQPTGEVSVPLPLHVRQFLKDMPRLNNSDALLLALRPLLQRVAVVTRRRRAVIVAACMVFPATIAVFMFLAGVFFEQWSRYNPGVFELMQLLQQRSWMRGLDNSSIPVPTERQFAVYIASHYRATVTNNTIWSNTMTLALINEEDRRFVQESVAQHPAPTGNEMAEANADLIKSQGRWSFSLDDIKDLSVFVNRLKGQADPVSAFLWHSLSNQDQTVLTSYQPAALSSNQVLQILDNIVTAPCIYEVERFKGVSLRPETLYLMKQSPTNLNLANINRYFVNRFLLEDAYPLALSKIQFTGPEPFFATFMQTSFAWMALIATLGIWVCLPAIIAALAFRGGLILLLTGVTFVRRDGAPASRLRLFWRALVTWGLILPAGMLGPLAFVWQLVPSLAGKFFEIEPFAFGLFCVLAIISVALPHRGLQDRLAGTWPVPR
jgi:eukaryotic-like serine/threonine-protein kinase